LTDAEFLAAYRAHGSARAMASAERMCRKAITKRLRRLALGAAAPPVGYDPVAVTTDGEGAVRSVRSVPEGTHTHKPIVLPDHAVQFVTTLLDGAGNIRAQYVRGERDKGDRYAAALSAVDRHFDELEERLASVEAVPAPRVEPSQLQTTLLLGDPHIGMLSWHLETGTDFDLSIAERQMNAAVTLLLDRCPPAHRLVIANLGDFFHAEDDKAVTPRGGNKLDVDGRAGKILDVGFGCVEQCVLTGLERYPEVVLLTLPGNHDPRLARVLERWTRARFRGEPRLIVLPADNPYVFTTWGQNLHMFHHGDGAKPHDLPAIMASYDDGKLWGAHVYRQIYTGHVHHLQRKEFPGVVWESSRTLAPGDYWHHHSGYRAGRGMRAVTHHAEHGHIREDALGAREVELALSAG
jgi:hypothetical protein